MVGAKKRDTSSKKTVTLSAPIAELVKVLAGHWEMTEAATVERCVRDVATRVAFPASGKGGQHTNTTRVNRDG